MRVLVTEHRARWFFAAHLQSALGTSAAYVALLVLAYDRLGSAWGASAVLLADLAPAMLLGRLVDRTSRLALAGAGNGLFVVTCRTMLQRGGPERVHGRAFGVLDAIDSWGFGAAMLLGGALAVGIGGRATFALAGLATLFVLCGAVLAARDRKGGAAWAASGEPVSVQA